MKTVEDYIKALREFPLDWPVEIDTSAGGGIAIEHREIGGKPVVAIFGSNGGRFGENPLTEEEYKKQSEKFLSMRSFGYRYTSIHGDHRLYLARFYGVNDSHYGTHFDRRIVERMISEGLIDASEVDVERVRFLDGEK